MKNGIQDKVNIARLQEKVESIDSRLDKIENNHIPHLHEKMEAIEKKIAYYSGALFVAISFLELIIRFFR